MRAKSSLKSFCTRNSAAAGASPACIGTAAFTLHGLSPGLPERVRVPLLMRVRVRVPVLAQERQAPAAAAAAARARPQAIAEQKEEDEGDDAAAAEDGDGGDDDGEDEDQDEVDEGDGEGAARRTGFAPTGSQLAVSLSERGSGFVDECVEVAAGVVTLECFYWPLPTPH